MSRSVSWLAIRLTLAGLLFAAGIGASLACGSHASNGFTDRLTTTVTTNGQVTTITTGP